MKELKESKIQEILQGNTESLNTEFKATLNSQGPSLRDRKSFLFLLEEKIRRAQIRKSEENFFAGWRVSASGGGLASFVGCFPKMRSDFVQGVEPVKILSHQ